MNLLNSLYPSLSSRTPLPAYYTPATFLLCILPFLFPSSYSRTQSHLLFDIVVYSLLLYLCLHWPSYTAGSPSNDYFNNSHFIAMPLWYLDFVILTEKDELAFIGKRNDTSEKPKKQNSRGDDGKSGVLGRRWSDLKTFSERFRWSLRLMLPAQRGLGWNWEVKGVPPNSDEKLLKWEYASKQLRWSLFFYVQSVGALIALGFGSTMQVHLRSEQLVMRVISATIVSWSGAIWVWNRLNCAYTLAAALAVASGLSDPWEWPPLMGSLKDAWSVRQMWSSTYHQVCRRLLSKPSQRITRLLGLRKGSSLSSYVQLFLSFGISCLFHQAQMFNVTRQDMGEFAFFMSQPVAIVLEDFACYVWKRLHLSSRTGRVERLIGYLWTFVWFSFSLRFYIGGLLQARVIEDWIWGYRPLEIGGGAASRLLRTT